MFIYVYKDYKATTAAATNNNDNDNDNKHIFATYKNIRVKSHKPISEWFRYVSFFLVKSVGQ